VSHNPGMRRISRKVAGITESATLAVDAKAKALKAAGEDVIGFGAGEPDFPTPAHIVEAAVAACRDERNHRYSPTSGLPELREGVAAKTARDSGFDCAPGDVLITNGGKQAVFNTFQTLLDPGDEVLLPAPYWTTYPEAITLAGGVPVELPTTEATGFRVSVEQLDAACTDRTKAMLFVSPSNPTGAVYPRDEVVAIGRWALDRGVWVVTDEIYEHLTYGGHGFTSMPAVVPDLADTCIVVNGVAKTYAMTGWRVGYVVANDQLSDSITKILESNSSCLPTVCQKAAEAALDGPREPIRQMVNALVVMSVVLVLIVF
jgi:aspartate aminotransferase